MGRDDWCHTTVLVSRTKGASIIDILGEERFAIAREVYRAAVQDGSNSAGPSVPEIDLRRTRVELAEKLHREPTEDDPLYVIRLFEVFFREYPREAIEVCGITIDRPFHEPPWKTLRRMNGLYGPTGVARIAARFLHVHQSRIPLPRRHVHAPAVEVEV